jgi:hypothetical protein
LGNIVAMVWFMGMFMTSYFINSGDISTETRRSGSLASHTGMSFAMDTFLLVEVNVKQNSSLKNFIIHIKYIIKLTQKYLFNKNI